MDRFRLLKLPPDNNPSNVPPNTAVIGLLIKPAVLPKVAPAAARPDNILLYATAKELEANLFILSPGLFSIPIGVTSFLAHTINFSIVSI